MNTDTEGSPDPTDRKDAEWDALSARIGMASHRLIGWIYWDPGALERYRALGVPPGFAQYFASRGGPLLNAGPEVVAAAFGSFPVTLVRTAIDQALRAADAPAITEARNEAVAAGLPEFAPEVCDFLVSVGPSLWQLIDELPVSGCVMFAAHRQWPRPSDPLVSGWLAVNCLRERRGDQHWAVLTAAGIDGVQAGLLHNDLLRYPPHWIPISRGAAAESIEAARESLSVRKLADHADVNEAGRVLRIAIEQSTDRLSSSPWRRLGFETAQAIADAIEPVSERLLHRIDATAGPLWMPAARHRRQTTSEVTA
jgi:hypothetical protein